MDLQKISEMLKTFPRPGTDADTPPTFLEISGYPQLENVASNILEFFFDTQAEHGFKTLFLEAVLTEAGVEINPAELEVESTHREAFTEANTRLDLVIGTNTLLVGIENKLFHGLENDFSLYEKHLQNQARGRKVVCVLLTLYPVALSPRLGKFIPVTYGSFFEQVRKLMGRFVVEANQRYVPFLFDFMQTIEHLQQENAMADADFRAWVAEHQEEIKDLLAEIRKFKGHLRDQVKALQGRIDVTKHLESGIKITPWLYEPTDLSVRRFLVYDFSLPGNLKINFDIILNATDWELYLGRRELVTMEALETFLDQCRLKNRYPFSAYGFRIGEKLPYDTDKAMIAARVQEIIDLIVATAQTQAKEGIA